MSWQDFVAEFRMMYYNSEIWKNKKTLFHLKSSFSLSRNPHSFFPSTSRSLPLPSRLPPLPIFPPPPVLPPTTKASIALSRLSLSRHHASLRRATRASFPLLTPMNSHLLRSLHRRDHQMTQLSYLSRAIVFHDDKPCGVFIFTTKEVTEAIMSMIRK
ncbi:hypothetical protein TIFTF001_027704 [Ficus carica]|uniref:Uncharacterized protein n=1 Tax=Ficus carica TaxID=3494 RepID=A0AA88DPQ2_FICCA|nr:hypothetical protein TIFTF001_026015 [Ficus carica]GMN58604.1 hypothetical protein TIFTF001_027704 [Ficus carica]